MKAIVFDRIGTPLDVLQLREIPVPQIGANEALVKVVCASINPGDFLFIQNLYPDPKKPRFPQQIAGTGGGIGIVEAASEDVSIKPGTLVAFSYYDAWAEYAAIPSQWLIPLPSDYPLEKGAQFANLISAWDLLNASKVQAGQWLALTAGNSTLATMVLQFARRRQINVVAIVRRARSDADLRVLGAAAIVETDGVAQGLRERIMEITNGKGLNAVIDCVGGQLAGELVRSMALGGQVIVYGGFSPDKFELHNFDILMSVLDIRSYAYRYFFDPPAPEDTKLLQEIAAASSDASFKIRVAALHPIEDFRAAVQGTLEYPELGKHFLRM